MKLDLQAGPRDASIWIIDCCYHATSVAGGISTVKHSFDVGISFIFFLFSTMRVLGRHDHNSFFMFLS